MSSLTDRVDVDSRVLPKWAELKIHTVTYRSQSDMYFRPKNYFTKFQAFTMATYHGLKIKEFAFLKLNTIISIELSLIVFQ